MNRFLGISAADKAAMGIHKRETTTTLVPDPTHAPRVNITYAEALQLIINMRNAATGKIGKPSGVGFMELWYKIGNPAPAGLMDANLKINIHDTGTAMTFLLSQMGKTIYFFARWVTKKGTFGTWSVYFSAVIVKKRESGGAGFASVKRPKLANPAPPDSRFFTHYS